MNYIQQHHAMANKSKEEQMNLALNGFKKGYFSSIQKAAAAFDVPPSTLMTHVNGKTSQEDTTANCWKLTDTEEKTLSK